MRAAAATLGEATVLVALLPRGRVAPLDVDCCWGMLCTGLQDPTPRAALSSVASTGLRTPGVMEPAAAEVLLPRLLIKTPAKLSTVNEPMTDD